MIAQVACTLVGLWLMAAPAVLLYAGSARTNDQIVGPIIATFACVAIWEATRAARWVNLPLGAWLILAPFALGFGGGPMINDILCGVTVASLACTRGKLTHRFGGGWRALWSGENVSGLSDE